MMGYETMNYFLYKWLPRHTVLIERVNGRLWARVDNFLGLDITEFDHTAYMWHTVNPSADALSAEVGYYEVVVSHIIERLGLQDEVDAKLKERYTKC
jgi:hypothetical protein